MFIVDSNMEMTVEKLQEFIESHKTEHTRYKELKDFYESKHAILSIPSKASYKPDNRLVVNFAKYIVDMLNGFFIGVPIKVSHESEAIDTYLTFVNKYNNQEDNDAELSKLCSIYGNAYELVYVDGDGKVGVTYINPMEAFVVYDNSIIGKPMYGVRYYTNTSGILEGSYSDNDTIFYFRALEDGTFEVYDESPHIFGGVPLIEYVENAEKMGAFENVKTLINAFNKALSEKANDVDYFADAYMKILGVALENEDLKTIRDDRIINLYGKDIDKLIVEFMEKPSADATQENLIVRLQDLIFQISMVMNINDSSFGTQSGIALKYKLASMENLAKMKERKFTAGLNRRYKMIAHTGLTPMGEDDWVGINYKFTRNHPANLLEESEIAKNLSGVTSKETALTVLSVVGNVQDEMGKIKEENTVPTV